VHLNIGLLILKRSRQTNVCLDPALVADLRFRHDAHLVSIALGDLTVARRQLISRIQVEDFNIPSLPVKGLVVKDDELVGLASFGDQFSFGIAVIEGCDASIFNLHSQLFVLENEHAALYLLDRDFRGFGDLEGLDVQYIAVATGNTGLAITNWDDLPSAPWHGVECYKTVFRARSADALNTKAVVQVFQDFLASLKYLGIELCPCQ
jgi:hypothetical protein